MTTELKMKLFTVEEANEALTDVAARLRKIQTLYAEIGELRESASAAAAASNFGGGMIGGSDYVEALYNVGKLTTELNDEGVQLKDYTRGLIDFPSMRDGRMVLLCWQLGEPERIEWWHEVGLGLQAANRCKARLRYCNYCIKRIY
ncbi:MAG: hypothetical protein DMF62_15530 [Acidobacteria bacterium]|nr:MAG: hypothetical protein DMF62_15530 [Acidobacteriota bacterium]